MLTQIDTLIAFSIIMLLFSLLITILVQSTQVMTKRRGWNLYWALILLFEQMGLKNVDARSLSRKVLTHRTLSPDGRSFAETIHIDELVRMMLWLKDKGDADALPVAQMLKRADGSEKISADQELSELRKQVSGWFDLVMNRAIERFGIHARRITIIFAFIVCFTFRVDAIGILREVSSNAALRERMVADTDATMQLYGEYAQVVEDAKNGARRSLEASLTELKTANNVGDKNSKVEGLLDLLSLRLGELTASLSTEAAGEQWLRTELTSRQAAEFLAEPDGLPGFQQELLESYARQVDLHLGGSRDELQAAAKGIMNEIDELGLNLLGIFQGGEFRPSRPWSLEEFLGVFAAALLLSLGAPFWFNALRNLSSLRPALAGKLDRGGSESKESTGTPRTSSSDSPQA